MKTLRIVLNGALSVGVVLSCVGVAIWLFSPAAKPADTVLTQSDDGAVVDLDEGGWLTIRLPGKAGGQWDEIDHKGSGAVCRMCKTKSFQDDFEQSNPDGSGTFQIRYRGWVSRDGKGITQADGESRPVTITLGYRNSKDEKPTSTFTFTAKVYTKKR